MHYKEYFVLLKRGNHLLCAFFRREKRIKIAQSIQPGKQEKHGGRRLFTASVRMEFKFFVALLRAFSVEVACNLYRNFENSSDTRITV